MRAYLYQNVVNGQLWAACDGGELLGGELSADIVRQPSPFHDWIGGGWVLNQAAQDAAHNADILAQITALEEKQIRPTRELLLDPANAYAKNKLADLEAQIVALRAQLVA